MRLYEAMILVTTAEASRDWDGLTHHVSDILTRNGAEVVDLRKWGERKLAYEIQHQRKATYILIHFEAPTNVIAEIRRELQLSERILRHLILLDRDGVEVKLLSELEEAQERAGGRREREKRAAKAGSEKPSGEEDKEPVTTESEEAVAPTQVDVPDQGADDEATAPVAALDQEDEGTSTEQSEQA